MTDEKNTTPPPDVAEERQEIGRLQATFNELVDITKQLSEVGQKLHVQAIETLPKVSKALEDERAAVASLKTQIESLNKNNADYIERLADRVRHRDAELVRISEAWRVEREAAVAISLNADLDHVDRLSEIRTLLTQPRS